MASADSRMASAGKSKGKSSSKVCVFCERNTNDEAMYGKLLSKVGITAHYFCMLFSSGLSQNGKSEKHGILGFLPGDVQAEVKRGGKLRCSYCRKVGATIGCVVRNCKKMFHFGCGRENNSLHLFYDTFSSFCQSHRPLQDVKADSDPNILCSICQDSLVPAPSINILKAPCCRKNWLHADCVQMYATSAGLHHFKCPLCNNKTDFQNEMLQFGIFIPEQDASWETEPNAFQELLERYDTCDAASCKCVEGRKYDKDDSKWEILLCAFCGSAGSHVACKHLVKLGDCNVCPDCFELDRKSREERAASGIPSPLPKKLSLEGFQSSPDSTKGSSPYPGPSSRVKKKYLARSITSPVASGSKSHRMSMRGKFEATSEISKNGKRILSPDYGSPPKLKKQKQSACETETSSSYRHQKNTSCFLTSSASSSLTSDSEDDIPLAWQIIEEQRRKERERKKLQERARKKQKRKSVATEMPNLEKIHSNSDKKMSKEKKKGKYKKGGQESLFFSSESDSDTEDYTKEDRVNNKLVVKFGAGNTKRSKRYSIAGTVNEWSDSVNVKPRLSLEPSVSHVGANMKKRQYTKTKKQSLETDKTQPSLEQFFNKSRKKVKEIPVNEIKEYGRTSKTCCELSPKRESHLSQRKRPFVMEWKGKQLIIHSPRVVLKRNKGTGHLKPRNLEIDMNDRKGSLDWNREMDMLTSIDTSVRVTRNMVDMENEGVTRTASSYTHSPAKGRNECNIQKESEGNVPIEHETPKGIKIVPEVTVNIPKQTIAKTENSTPKQTSSIVDKGTPKHTTLERCTPKNDSRSDRNAFKDSSSVAEMGTSKQITFVTDTDTHKRATRSNTGTPKKDARSDMGTPKKDARSDMGTPKRDSTSDTGTPKRTTKSETGTPKRATKSEMGIPNMLPMPEKESTASAESGPVKRAISRKEDTYSIFSKSENLMLKDMENQDYNRNTSGRKTPTNKKEKLSEAENDSQKEVTPKRSMSKRSKQYNDSPFKNLRLRKTQDPENDPKEAAINDKTSTPASDNKPKYYSLFTGIKSANVPKMKTQVTQTPIEVPEIKYTSTKARTKPNETDLKLENIKIEDMTGYSLIHSVEMAVEQRTPTQKKENNFQFVDMSNENINSEHSSQKAVTPRTGKSLFNDSPAKNLRLRKAKENDEFTKNNLKDPITPTTEMANIDSISMEKNSTNYGVPCPTLISESENYETTIAMKQFLPTHHRDDNSASPGFRSKRHSTQFNKPASESTVLTEVNVKQKSDSPQRNLGVFWYYEGTSQLESEQPC